MVVSNDSYDITKESGKQYITNKVSGAASLQFKIYAYNDTSLLTALTDEILDEDEKLLIDVCENGRYYFIISYSGTTDTLEYVYFPYYETKVITEIKNILCNCDNCKDESALDNCNDCLEADDIKSGYSFLIYMISHIYLFTEQASTKRFSNYMNEAFKLYELAFKTRFNYMFYNGVLKGTYPLSLKTLSIYYIILFVYYYESDYLDDTDTDYVDTKYYITEVKACIALLGISYDDIKQVFNDTYDFGKYMLLEQAEMALIADVCTEITDLRKDLDYDKNDFETGFTISILNTSKHLIFIIPKSWGTVTSIYDDGGANLITDFTLNDCTTLNVYSLDYVLPPGNYNFKFIIQ